MLKKTASFVLGSSKSGAGFLVRYRREGYRWTSFDTEVVWTVQVQGEPEEEPLLAP
jgi:hypothetical protein